MANLEDTYRRESLNTGKNLQTIAQSLVDHQLSRLSLPEINEVSEMVGRILPAGNIPGLILSGLARLPSRKPPRDVLHRDIDILFKGVHQTLEKAVYSAFFAGPAAVIWGYQNLLRLAGKDAEEAFPDGTWQFYVEYALREDTARHSNETRGFDALLNKHQIYLSPVDRMSALTIAAIQVLHDFPALLENEWRERIYTHILLEITQGSSLHQETLKIYRQWEQQRPYKRERDAQPTETYSMYRKRRFDSFLEQILTSLDPDLQRLWLERVQRAKQDDLPAYLEQMSILSYLQAQTYHETRSPIALQDSHIGIIYQGQYYLIPACLPHTQRAPELETIRSQIAAIAYYPADRPSVSLRQVLQIPRSKLQDVYAGLNMHLLEEFQRLRLAPIFINFDQHRAELPLSDLRQAERGIGDHALTIFDTGKSFVFDQSHIFFDGAWGSALAEIITNEALSWAVHLSRLPEAQIPESRSYSPILKFSPNEERFLASFPTITPEVGVEADHVSLTRLLALRKLFKQRSDLLQLTVNDLLILYRAIHAVTYEPSPYILSKLDELKAYPAAALALKEALQAVHDSSNPAILIPIDASQRSPRERLYPMSFEVPLRDLNLIELHQQVMVALSRYEHSVGDRSESFQQFNNLQRDYLATLAGFGAVLSKAKDIAIIGESASVGTIKLLAHMPTPLQRLLDQIPGRFDVLNDIIKGREIFSNVGVVAPNSSLTRFITAKDDNEKKTLAWGVITDAAGTMRISLRDFRPHVGLLQAAGFADLALLIAQDYLDTYINGFNQYVSDLQQLTRASRETRIERGDSPA